MSQASEEKFDVQDELALAASELGEVSDLTRGNFGSNQEAHTSRYDATRSPTGPKRFSV